MPSPIVILGHQRSGTNFINELLQKNNKISMLDEPISMHTRSFQSWDMIPWSADSYDPVFLHRALYDKPTLIIYLQEMRKWLQDTSSNNIRGFKETLLFDKLPWLSEFLEKPKLIFVVRDPRAIISSILKVNNAESLWGFEQSVQRYFSLCPLSKNQWPTTPLQYFAWSIKIRWDLAYKYLELFDFLTVRLEDLIDNKEETLEKIMNFIGESPTYKQINFLNESQTQQRGGMYSSYRDSAEVKLGWKKILTIDERHYIEAILDDHMRKLHYT